MYGSGFAGPPKTVLRARGTLFWPKVARELMKFNGTRTIRSEIARGIDCNRSRGPEMDKMGVFDTPTCMEVALQVPHHGVTCRRFGYRFHEVVAFWVHFHVSVRHFHETVAFWTDFDISGCLFYEVGAKIQNLLTVCSAGSSR